MPNTSWTSSIILGILDPPPTNSTESNFISNFFISSLKLSKYDFTSLNIYAASLSIIYLVRGSLISSSYIKHSIVISVYEMPDKIFLCL